MSQLIYFGWLGRSVRRAKHVKITKLKIIALCGTRSHYVALTTCSQERLIISPWINGVYTPLLRHYTLTKKVRRLRYRIWEVTWFWSYYSRDSLGHWNPPPPLASSLPEHRLHMRITLHIWFLLIFSLNWILSIKFKYFDNYIHVVNKFGIWKKANMLILIHHPKSMQYKIKASTQ